MEYIHLHPMKTGSWRHLACKKALRLEKTTRNWPWMKWPGGGWGGWTRRRLSSLFPFLHILVPRALSFLSRDENASSTQPPPRSFFPLNRQAERACSQARRHPHGGGGDALETRDAFHRTKRKFWNRSEWYRNFPRKVSKYPKSVEVPGRLRSLSIRPNFPKFSGGGANGKVLDLPRDRNLPDLVLFLVVLLARPRSKFCLVSWNKQYGRRGSTKHRRYDRLKNVLHGACVCLYSRCK